MILLKKYNPPVRRLYIYITAFLFSLIVLNQYIITNDQGQFTIKLSSLLFFIINYLTWVLMISWVCGLYQLFVYSFPLNIKKGGVFILNFIIIISIHFLISNVANYFIQIAFFSLPINSIIPDLIAIIPQIILSRVADLIAILILLKIVYTYKIAQERKLQISDLENELHLSQLRSLRAQLNPHFLFNSLHALHTLIGYDDTKAKAMTIKISNLLRKMLDHSDQHQVPLEDELAYLKDYLEIEQERFHDRLQIEFQIEESTKKINVPTLLLQPLAENAIKHGISLLEDKGIIKLTTKMIDTNLHIEMSNTIPKDDSKSSSISTKVGLTNTKNRLQQLYGDHHSLEIKKTQDMFKISIVIKHNTL